MDGNVGLETNEDNETERILAFQLGPGEFSRKRKNNFQDCENIGLILCVWLIFKIQHIQSVEEHPIL